MIILAIDTSGPNCAVCVARGTGDGIAIVAERCERIGRGHAERLIPMIREALGDARLAFADLDRIAVATGPGSFTGVRVGVAAARGLALALTIEAVGIGSLEALAAEARHAAADGIVLAALAAPRDAVFAFAIDGGAVRLAPTLTGPAELARTIVAWGRQPVTLTGSGAPRIAADLAQDRPDVEVVGEADTPAVGWIARLGLMGQGTSPPRPVYLRPADAKPQIGHAVARA